MKQTKSWAKNLNGYSDKRIRFKWKDSEIFKNNSKLTNGVVKNRLKNLPSYVHECSSCHNSTWMTKKIPLELDHKNGNNRDNRRKNLRWLCPNCHAFTESYRGRNVKNKTGDQRMIPDDKFKQALLESTCIRQALIKLGLTPRGGNYKRAHELSLEL